MTRDTPPFDQCRVCWTFLHRCPQCFAWTCSCKNSAGRVHYDAKGERYRTAEPTPKQIPLLDWCPDCEETLRSGKHREHIQRERAAL